MREKERWRERKSELVSRELLRIKKCFYDDICEILWLGIVFIVLLELGLSFIYVFIILV